MPKVTYIQSDGTRRIIELAEGLSLMIGARNHNIEGIEGDCGGVCACATCHVYVDPNWTSRVGGPGADEAEMLECVNNPKECSRLSCQIRMTAALSGVIVNLPASQR